MSAKAALKAVVERLRKSADLYRENANRQDKQAVLVECLEDLDEPRAQEALKRLMEEKPQWFPS